VDPAEQRKRSRDNWAAAAAGWLKHADRQRRQTMPVSMWMLDALGPQAGDTVLELAAGPGDLGFLATEMVAPGGTVISTDFVPEMVSAAQQRAQALGVENVRFRQLDAQSIDFDAASLDGVLCRWGYMLMADGEAALRETRRVLKPGARVALAVHAAPEYNPWMALIGRELASRGWVEPPEPGSSGPFDWAKEGVLEERLQAAGFTEYSIEPLDFTMHDESPEVWLEVTRDMSRNFAGALSGRSPDEVDDLLRALVEAAAPFARDDGSVAFPARSWGAWAAA
jgi:SAM-dependent methyltransferase